MEANNANIIPVSVVLVDDDSAFTAKMRGMLERYCEKENGELVFTAFPDAGAFWAEYGALRPDIVFFDIQLPGENGIETAKKLFARDKRPAIVFVTASPDFAMQGYGVNALGYIMKPPADEALARILAAARERLRSPAAAPLTVRNTDGAHILRIAAVTHLESLNRHVLIHTDEGTVEYVGRLDDFPPLLPPEFLRVHKSFIVNMDRVRRVRAAEMHLDDGTPVPISRSYRRLAAEVFFERLGKETEE
jgi:DNA-binding LytR/AlgR family response regulator